VQENQKLPESSLRTDPNTKIRNKRTDGDDVSSGSGVNVLIDKLKNRQTDKVTNNALAAWVGKRKSVGLRNPINHAVIREGRPPVYQQSMLGTIKKGIRL